MKKLLAVLAAGAVALAIAACGTPSTLTFAQQVSIVCAATSAELTTLQASGVFTGGAQATLTKQVQPDVAAVCAAGATVTKANLQNLVNATLPVVVTAVGNSNLSQPDKTAAVTAVGAIATGVGLAIALMPAAVPTATAASSASAASAPAAGAATQ